MANEFIARKGLIISGSSFKAESTAIPSGGTSNEVVVLESDGTLKTKTNASSSGSSGSSGTSGANGSSGSSGTSGAKGDPGTASEVIDVYDNAGGQTFTTTPITVNLDTTRYNSNGSIFTLSNDEITVNTDIRALIIFRVSIDIGSGTARSTSTAYIERDTGSGFSEVDGSRIFMYNRTLGNGSQTGTGQLVLDVSSGDKFRIQAVRNTGTDTLVTIADGSGLTITDLMGGEAGPSGAAGSSGSSGSSGTSGANGSSGSSGTSGANGSSGSSGTSGTSGANGSSGSSGTSGANGSSGSSGTSGANGANGSSGSSGSSGTSGANGSSGSSGTSGTSFVGSITGTTSNGILTYVNATNNLAVESNLTYNSSTSVLTLSPGEVNFTNLGGTYLTSKTGGGPGEWWVYLGDSGSATGWLSVSELFGITGSIQGETFRFGDTNGFEISTDLTTQGTIYARDGIRSVASGTGEAGYSNQFYSLPGETATFAIFDPDEEETFRVTGSIANRNYKIEFGDLAGSEEGNKFVLEDESRQAYFTNNGLDFRFGINTNNPQWPLDVVGPARFSNREYTTYTPGSAGASIGDIIRIGTGTTVAGKTYHFNGTGWTQTNANPASSPATSGSLVAIALGTSPTANGMLIRGIAYPATISGMSGGETVYFDSTDGTLTISPPGTSTYIVRIAGHALSSTAIYFNPSPDWLIVA